VAGEASPSRGRAAPIPGAFATQKTEKVCAAAARRDRRHRLSYGAAFMGEVIARVT
jgi:hypothetical protein